MALSFSRLPVLRLVLLGAVACSPVTEPAATGGAGGMPAASAGAGGRQGAGASGGAAGRAGEGQGGAGGGNGSGGSGGGAAAIDAAADEGAVGDAAAGDVTSSPDVAAPAPGPLATSSAACGKGLPVPAEAIHDLMVGAVSRRFFLRVPSGYNGKKPWPVIFGFHGAGNKTAAWFDTNTDLRAQTEDKAILVFPEGPAKPTGERSWVFMSADNVVFVDAMIDWLKQNLCIDPSHLFATGQSSGGYMAMTLGCQRGNVFRAVATSSGGILDPGACTGSPAAFWIRTGKADTASTHDSVLKTRDFWVANQACDAASAKPVTPAPCLSYSGCKAGASVIFCDDTGAHGWPSYMTKGMWDLFTSK